MSSLKYSFLLLFFITGFAKAQNNLPEISIELNGEDKASGSNYAFAQQNVNTNSNIVTFTIQNSGTANLTISDINLSGSDADQFTLVKNTTPSVVTTGGSTTFTVTFSPKNNAPALKNAVITILNDDDDERTYTIGVTGTAIIEKATITSLTPVRAAVGAVVTINGTNLINTTSVAFDGVPATTFTIVNNTRVTATVPAGATSGPISVTNGAGTVISTQTFFVTPRITSLSPTAGPIGSNVVITGTSFTGTTSVRFNGREALFTVNNDNQIIAVVPNGATIGTVTVTTPSGTGVSTQTFTPPPTITSLSATSGIISDVITINGTNFPSLATTVVKFTGKTGTNTITATRSVVNSTRITVTVPVGAVTGPITITTIAGTVSSPNFSIANTTYTWNNGTGTGNWSDPNNWTPARSSPTSNDVLLFDGSVTASPIVTLDFASPETIGYLGISNNAAVTFTVTADKALTIDNVNVSSLADFVVAAGSSLTVTNSVSSGGADLTINIASGETGSVAGTVTFQGEETAEHRLLATYTNNVAGLTFLSGGRFIAGTNLSGSPFAGGINNSVTFTNGSFYNNRAGDSPFGAASPNAVVVFSATSTYSHEVNSAPDVVNRTYGNFIISNVAGATTAFNQTVAGAGNLRILSNFTQTAPAGVPAPTFNLNLEGNITISGILTVNTGTLSFNPASASNIIVTNNLITNNTSILNFNPSSPITVSLGGNITLNNTSRLNADNTSELTTIRLTGANRTISGPGVFFLGTKANLSVETGASVTLAKSIIGTGAVTVNGTVRTANPNGLASGPATSFVEPLQVTFNVGSTADYNGTTNQVISGLNYSNLIISGARVNRTITLPANVKVSGVFSLTATGVTYNTTTNNSTIEFTGGAQTIPAAFTYNNITVSGTGDKVLAANVIVNGQLLMGERKVDTNGNFLILGPTATIQGESSTSYVVGNLSTSRNVTSTTSSDFGGMGIWIGEGSLGSRNLGLTTVTRRAGPGSSVTVEGREGINRTWQVVPTSQPGGPIQVSLSWVAADDNGKDLTLARVWKTEGQDETAYYDVSKTNQDANSRRITVTVSSFSIFTVSDQNNPLPVELLSFKATKRGTQAVLSWQTAWEKDNQGFGVEVSSDAQTFREVGFVKAVNANSGALQEYAFQHRVGSRGVVYYRLRQTDYAGTTTYYGPKALNFDQITPVLLVYPNPVTDKNADVTILVGPSASEKATIIITDIRGKVVYGQVVAVNLAQPEVKVNLSQQPAGVYVVCLTTLEGTTQTRIVKQ